MGCVSNCLCALESVIHESDTDDDDDSWNDGFNPFVGMFLL